MAGMGSQTQIPERPKRTNTGTVRLLCNQDNLAKCDYWLGPVYTVTNDAMGNRCLIM